MQLPTANHPRDADNQHGRGDNEDHSKLEAFALSADAAHLLPPSPRELMTTEFPTPMTAPPFGLAIANWVITTQFRRR